MSCSVLNRFTTDDPQGVDWRFDSSEADSMPLCLIAGCPAVYAARAGSKLVPRLTNSVFQIGKMKYREDGHI